MLYIKRRRNIIAYIVSVGTATPPYAVEQEQVERFVKDLFQSSFRNIDRLLPVFKNANIQKRYFAAPLSWFSKDHSFQEKNDLFIQNALELSKAAVEKCLLHSPFLKRSLEIHDIEAIFFITSTGIATPSIEARLMNVLPFSKHTKRIPIWGLGCAGGAAGISRAFEYCQAFPKANVLVISVELCSLTFQRNDRSKSNLIGTSLFADGVACCLICGKDSPALKESKLNKLPKILASQSTLLEQTEEVMGWDVRNDGLYVIFSKDIPALILRYFSTFVETLLAQHGVTLDQIRHFIAHPGGRKVLEAYSEALHVPQEKFEVARTVLQNYGNMSSATIFFVLLKYLQKEIRTNDFGMITALGPGFSSEIVLLQWE